MTKMLKKPEKTTEKDGLTHYVEVFRDEINLQNVFESSQGTYTELKVTQIKF